ncbi:hypothetical protein AAFN86_13785 [Roseomonas sp. CAU 1739]
MIVFVYGTLLDRDVLTRMSGEPALARACARRDWPVGGGYSCAARPIRR